MSKELSATDYKTNLHRIIYRLSELGLTQKEIAYATDYTQGNVSHILSKINTQGHPKEYEVGHSSGRPTRLDGDQIQLLRQQLEQGAKAVGFPSDGWTRIRVHDFIKAYYKVDYSLPHISRLMKKLGYTLQEPQVKDTRRNKAQEVYYEQKVIPQLKKN